MGVIYKLRKEVVDFILNEKKLYPALSCRKVVDIVQKKFQIKLSKSSINNIFKSAHLSNPVGRRASEETRTKRFQIPEHKKPRFFIPPDMLSSTVEASVKNSMDTTKVHTGKMQKDVLLNKMGCIFLKAAEWELAASPVLGRLIREHVGGKKAPNGDAAGELLFFMQAFGVKSLAEIVQDKGQCFRALSELPESGEEAFLLKGVQEIPEQKKLLLKASFEIPQLFAELNFLKIFIEDGTEVNVDARGASSWPKGSQIPIFSTLKHGLRLIAKNIINNVEPLVLCSAYVERDVTGVSSHAVFSQGFYNMLAAFENIPGKRIKQVAAYNSQEQEIASFTTIPDKKRIFISGIWPGHPEFKQLWAASAGQREAERGFSLKYTKLLAEEKKTQDFSGLSQDVYFIEENILFALPRKEGLYTQAPSSQNEDKAAIRVFFLNKTSTGAPFLAVITNATEKEMSASQVILDYLVRWPNLQAGQQAALEKQIKENSFFDAPAFSQQALRYVNKKIKMFLAGEGNFLKIAQMYVSLLDQYCQRRFFSEKQEGVDLSARITTVYGAAGFLEKNNDFIKVTLVTPENKADCQGDLDFAIKKINESAIYDYKGRQLILRRQPSI